MVLLDVIIIGAGWAGVGAANRLMMNDITSNFEILEAQDYVGGRSRTINDYFKEGMPTEIGSAWLYPSTSVHELVDDLGLQYSKSKYSYDLRGIYDKNGEIVGDTRDELMNDEYRNKFVPFARNEISPETDLETIVEDFFDEEGLNADESDPDRQIVNALLDLEVNVEFGAPYDKLNSPSVYIGDDAEYELEYFAVPGGGYGNAIMKVAEPFMDKIKFKSKVKKIDSTGEVVEVTYEDESGVTHVKYAKTAIVTTSLGVLQADDIEFVPAHSKKKQKAINRIGFGTLNKVIMWWDQTIQDVSWWPQDKNILQLMTESDEDSGDWKHFMVDQAIEGNENNYIMTAWAGGDAANRLEAKSDEETVDIVMENLSEMFGDSVPQPEKVIVSRWKSEEFMKGSYSFSIAGKYSNWWRKILAKPEGKLFWAGEAANYYGGYGTAYGAYDTGFVAANRVKNSGILTACANRFDYDCDSVKKKNCNKLDKKTGTFPRLMCPVKCESCDDNDRCNDVTSKKFPIGDKEYKTKCFLQGVTNKKKFKGCDKIQLDQCNERTYKKKENETPNYYVINQLCRAKCNLCQ